MASSSPSCWRDSYSGEWFSWLQLKRQARAMLADAGRPWRERKFGRDAGAFVPLLAASPHAGTIVAALGGVPGSFLDAVAVAAAPESFCGGPTTQWRASATPTR